MSDSCVDALSGSSGFIRFQFYSRCIRRSPVWMFDSRILCLPDKHSDPPQAAWGEDMQHPQSDFLFIIQRRSARTLERGHIHQNTAVSFADYSNWLPYIINAYLLHVVLNHNELICLLCLICITWSCFELCGVHLWGEKLKTKLCFWWELYKVIN